MCRGGRGRPAHRGSAQGCRGRTSGGGIACSGGGPLAQGVEGVAEAVAVEGSKPGFGGAKLGFGDDRGGVAGVQTGRIARGAGWGSEAELRLACPLRSVRRNTLFLDGFDPRQIRPRLPAPAGALPRPPRQARPDLRTSGRWQAPCRRACALRQRPGGASTGSPADRAGRFGARRGAAVGFRPRPTAGRAHSHPPKRAVGRSLISRHAARRRCVRAGNLRPGNPARQGRAWWVGRVAQFTPRCGLQGRKPASRRECPAGKIVQVAKRRVRLSAPERPPEEMRRSAPCGWLAGFTAPLRRTSADGCMRARTCGSLRFAD